jgi:hypothetical protein
MGPFYGPAGGLSSPIGASSGLFGGIPGCFGKATGRAGEPPQRFGDAGSVDDRIASATERTAKGIDGLCLDVRNNRAAFS